MRRIHSVIKDGIMMARYTAVRTMEMQEAQVEAYGLSNVSELEEAYDEMIRAQHNALLILIGTEVGEVVREFGIEGEVNHPGSAFPQITQIEESISEYVLTLIDDILTLVQMPAVTIIDELEEWLNDLWDFHANKLENSDEESLDNE